MTDDIEPRISFPEEGSEEYWHQLTQPPLVHYAGGPDLPEATAHQHVPHWEHDNVRRVSAETRDAAAHELTIAMAVDPEIGEILTRQHGMNGSDVRALVDTIRDDADLRYDLAMHFKGKLLQHGDQLPDRVRQNGYKELNHGIYASLDALRSQDYAVMLALSMIDGTFDAAASELDTIDVPIGKGTHRATAHLLLG